MTGVLSPSTTVTIHIHRMVNVINDVYIVLIIISIYDLKHPIFLNKNTAQLFAQYTKYYTNLDLFATNKTFLYFENHIMLQFVLVLFSIETPQKSSHDTSCRLFKDNPRSTKSRHHFMGARKEIRGWYTRTHAYIIFLFVRRELLVLLRSRSISRRRCLRFIGSSSCLSNDLEPRERLWHETWS